MSKSLFVLSPLLFIFLTSCLNQTDTTTESTPKELIFKTVTADEICSIEVPLYFEPIEKLNDQALIQYGYIDKDTTQKLLPNDAIFVTTSVFYKMDLQKIIGDTVQFSLLEFNTDFVENISLAIDEAKALHETPLINEQNGVKSIHNEIYGSYDTDLVYYQIGLFETEIGYYQIITWCLQDHLAKHKDEMYKITTSFKEI